ncbi:MAG: peptidoglycan DD-metalloendopeptidase family protein [Oligoflexia bacterium]|nr:peptidoglycan DD-metalloendopeptidase family protein [Oligoflexia bacterium]
MNFSVWVIVSILLAVPNQGLAITDRVDDIRSKLEAERKALLDSELKKRGVMGTLYEINKTLGKLEQDITSLESQLAKSQKTVEGYAKRTSYLKMTREKQKVLLRERLRALYKMGFKGYTEVLLSSESGGEFARNLKFLKIVTKRDAELINSFKSTIVKLDHQERKLRSQLKIFVKIQGDLKAEKSRFDSEKAKQSLVLQELERNKETHLMAIKEWREAVRDLDRQLEKMGQSDSTVKELSRGAIYEHKGGLRPPVLREIVQKHGIVKNHRFGTQILHKGLFFAAKQGDRISSLYWGKVAFSGWVNGYGETIIIDHGDHYYSLYAHNSKLLKKTGDSVGQGEIIAESGDTGSLRGPGLYFELRHFSDSLDPVPWLDLRTSRRL